MKNEKRKKVIMISIAFVIMLIMVLIFTFATGIKNKEGEAFAKKADSTGEETTEKRKSMYEMTAEEAYQTLLDNGFVLPDSWETYGNEQLLEELKEEIKETVDYIIENNGVYPAVSFTERDRLYSRIQKIVVVYEGMEDPYEGHDFESDIH